LLCVRATLLNRVKLRVRHGDVDSWLSRSLEGHLDGALDRVAEKLSFEAGRAVDRRILGSGEEW